MCSVSLQTWAAHVAQHRRDRVQASLTRTRRRALALLGYPSPAPGTPSAKRSVGTRRAASMQDTLSEGTARAAQLAPTAVTASAVGGTEDLPREVWLADDERV